jgi:hypothetical protein
LLAFVAPSRNCLNELNHTIQSSKFKLKRQHDVTLQICSFRFISVTLPFKLGLKEVRG